jgi:hypothetical protein
MWLPSFLQRGIHFFDQRTEVLAFNNFVLFDRVHLPIIGKRAAVVERIYCLCEARLLIIQDRLRRGLAHFKLVAHFLEACCECFNLLLLFGYDRSLLLHLAVLFENLVEQHCVYRVVAHDVDLAVLVAHN